MEVEVNTNSNNNKGLNTGAIVGISIGAVVALLAIAFAIYWFCYRNKKYTQVPTKEEVDGLVA